MQQPSDLTEMFLYRIPDEVEFKLSWMTSSVALSLSLSVGHNFEMKRGSQDVSFEIWDRYADKFLHEMQIQRWCMVKKTEWVRNKQVGILDKNGLDKVKGTGISGIIKYYWLDCSVNDRKRRLGWRAWVYGSVQNIVTTLIITNAVKDCKSIRLVSKPTVTKGLFALYTVISTEQQKMAASTTVTHDNTARFAKIRGQSSGTAT